VTYPEFIAEIKAKLGYEIPDEPIIVDTCENCGKAPHDGRCKRTYNPNYVPPYDVEGQELGYKNGSFIALLWKNPLDTWRRSEHQRHVPLQTLLLKWEIGTTSEERGFRPSDDNTEPAWEHLDAILEHFYPNITYLRYKALMKEAQSGTFVLNEYYGNSATFTCRLLGLRDLWKFIQNDQKRLESK